MDLKTYLSAERGRASAMARDLGISPVTVHQWANGKAVPAARCPLVEKLTGGAVSCEDLRPDLAEHWSFLRGTSSKAAA